MEPSVYALTYTYTIAQVGPVVNQKRKINLFYNLLKSLDSILLQSQKICVIMN